MLDLYLDKFIEGDLFRDERDKQDDVLYVSLSSHNEETFVGAGSKVSNFKIFPSPMLQTTLSSAISFLRDLFFVCSWC